jgi:RNA polymerase Rpb1, domain 2
VPRSIALNLTVPEVVTAFNHNELAKLVAKGPLEHPGTHCNTYTLQCMLLYTFSTVYCMQLLSDTQV